MLSRRNFFKRVLGLSALGGICCVQPRWVINTADAAFGHSLLVIFLRGGCDGLNVVVPHGDDEYHRQRPSIRIPSPGPGATDPVIDIDGYFGLHPALVGVSSLYRSGKVALLPAVHYADAPRSHFQSQAFIEQAGGAAGSGWLNRYLAAVGGEIGMRGLAFSPDVPASMQGALPVRAFNSLTSSVLSRYIEEENRLVQALAPQMTARVTEPATATVARLREAGRIALEDLDILRDLGASSYQPSVEYPATIFGERLRDAAFLVKSGRGLEVATIDLSGWDAHVGQGNGAQGGRQARALATLDAGLSAFFTDLGSFDMQVTVLVMTEFGRTLAQNANAGTDHGNASAWLVLGGGVRGGIHFGSRGWPGLAPEQLREGRDLAHTLEFKDVMAELLVRHLGMSAGLVSTVVPGASGEFPGFV